jgi:hypothetical protein
MTYERMKTGTFRVFVFMTIWLEAYVITHKSHGKFEMYGTYWKIELALVLAPILLWGTYFFSL